ncbi:NACHT domain-containing protein [Fusarium sp. LHS14.1]|nr:NACHT domain-containing protein [Fusarium sp. LHS14.1]
MARPERLMVAVHNLKAILDPGLQREISPCTTWGIHDTILKMNLADTNLPMKQLWAKFREFVRRLEEWDHIEELLLTKDEFSRLIWGPMNFLIEKEDRGMFDRLIYAYSKIGQEIAQPVELVQFTQLGGVNEILSEVLDFHRKALGLLRNTGLGVLFRSEPEQSHESLREVPEDERSDTGASERSKTTIDSDDKTQKAEERHKLAMSELKVKLQSLDYRGDYERFTQHRNAFNSGNWVFSDAEFQSWYGSTSSRILCINGLHGMGKTVLMLTVINNLLDVKHLSGSEMLVGYFYFSHCLQEPHNNLLRALLEQFMDQDGILLSELVDEHLHAYADGIRKTEILQYLVKRVIETHRTTFLVLDGLDQCSNKEVDQTVKWLCATAGDLPDGSILRIIISTRRDKIQKRFSLSPEYGEEVAEKVAKLSNGNFLYVRILLRHILSYQATSNPGWSALSLSSFPPTMAEVCYRAMSQLRNSKEALKLLGLLMVAERPLRWREAQALFCMDAERPTVQTRELCRGVVDVYRVMGDDSCSEEMIRMLHPTIKKTLLERDPNMINEDIDFYEPLDYTVQHWYHHAKAIIEAPRFRPGYDEAIMSLGAFLWTHMREAPYWNGQLPRSIPAVLELFKHIHEDAQERNLQLRLESRVSLIRRQIENLYWNKMPS